MDGPWRGGNRYRACSRIKAVFGGTGIRYFLGLERLVKNGKIIVRVKGGLGNQLFCYAAARRLAMANDVELVIDDVTGFIRDHKYRRKYALDSFSIPSRKATPWERMEPFERYRRGIAKFLAKSKPFHMRNYIEQEGTDFDPRLLEFRLKGTACIDGLWQSEKYFKNVEAVIRRDLRIIPPNDAANREMAEKVRGCDSICIHVRWNGKPDAVSGNTIERSYYTRAVQYIIDRVPTPHFFLFSDAPVASTTILSLPKEMVTRINCNSGDENAYADLWLMSHCKHFIIADSTFSWWGAWLANSESKFVVAPEVSLTGNTLWNFPGLIPDKWALISSETRNCR
jgi:Glycosyl transferase family 11